MGIEVVLDEVRNHIETTLPQYDLHITTLNPQTGCKQAVVFIQPQD